MKLKYTTVILHAGCMVGIAMQSCSTYKKEDSAKKTPNIIFITIDDLMTNLNCYGNSILKTPNIDQLLKESTFFEHAYCQQSLSVPSRASFLTGLRPESCGVTEFHSPHFRKTVPETVTLPQFFRNQGYVTLGVGKVFHTRDSSSWDSPVWVPQPEISYPIYTNSANLAYQEQRISDGKAIRKSSNWWAAGGYWTPAASFEISNSPDSLLFDGLITQKAIEIINENVEKNLFLSVGYFRPHIPFIAPKEYYDLYPLSSIELSPDSVPPINVPDVALHNWGETRLYNDIPYTGNISDQQKKELIRAYYACITFVDAQIGKLIKTLKDQDLYDNSLIILCADNGYHLGDFNLWGKYTNFENGTRVPLIMKLPHQKKAQTISNPVELLDIYPTVLDVLDFDVPDFLEGKSLYDNNNHCFTDNENFAFSQYPRAGYTGYSVRSPKYRYTVWKKKGEETFYEFYEYVDNVVEKKNIFEDSHFLPEIEMLQDKLDEVFSKYYAE